MCTSLGCDFFGLIDWNHGVHGLKGEFGQKVNHSDHSVILKA